jgi:hypothetical protein
LCLTGGDYSSLWGRVSYTRGGSFKEHEKFKGLRYINSIFFGIFHKLKFLRKYAPNAKKSPSPLNDKFHEITVV